jgi:hypothetical protein
MIKWLPIAGKFTAKLLDSKMRSLVNAVDQYRSKETFIWWYDDVLGSTTDAQMNFSGGAHGDVTILRAGHVVGLFVHSNTARTAGTLDIDLYIDAVDTGYSVQLNGTDTEKALLWLPREIATFVDQGEEINLLMTTSGWTPVTADICAGVMIEYTEEDKP